MTPIAARVALQMRTRVIGGSTETGTMFCACCGLATKDAAVCADCAEHDRTATCPDLLDWYGLWESAGRPGVWA